MKKWIAAMLALVMALTLCTVSWADENYVTIDGLVDENGALVHYETLTAAAKAWREKNGVTTSGAQLGANTLGTVESVIWRIHGTVSVGDGEGVTGTSGSVLGMGYFSPAVTFNNIVIEGVGTGAAITEGSVSAGGKNVTFRNITFKEEARNESDPENLTFEGCTFEKGLRMPHSADNANLTVKNCTFTNNGTADYAIFVQGKNASAAQFTGNNISGYQRGMNVQLGSNAVVEIKANTIKDLVGKTQNEAKYGSAIQLTSAKTFTVEGNTIANVQVNALHIYKDCAADIAINNNNIDAAYLLLNEAPNTAEVTSADNTVSAATNTTKGLTKNGELAETTTTINVKAPASNNYYYYSPSTTTDTAKGSPKTFDAGVGVYAVTAVLSLSGMAWTAKKRH